jgi:hypothetical protein
LKFKKSGVGKGSAFFSSLPFRGPVGCPSADRREMAYYLVELVVFDQEKDHIYDKSIRHQCLQGEKNHPIAVLHLPVLSLIVISPSCLNQLNGLFRPQAKFSGYVRNCVC